MCVFAGEQQVQSSEGQQCRKWQWLVHLHSQQQPRPALPKWYPGHLYPSATHQPTQVNITVRANTHCPNNSFFLYLKGLIAIKKLTTPLCNYWSLTFLSLRQPPQWKHWWRPLGAAITCLLTGRLSMTFLVCGLRSTSFGGGVNFDSFPCLQHKHGSIFYKLSLVSHLTTLSCIDGSLLMLSCFIFRCHNSTGDLKRLDSSLPPSPHSSSSHGDTQPQGFRRRASTFSHPPSPSSAEYSPVHTLTQSPQDPTAAAKPKLVRHYSVSTDTPHQSK